MTIFLVRHTEYSNPGNVFPMHLPVELSEKGKKHSKRIAKWFKNNLKSNLVIYSSPVNRCLQTSKYISDINGCKVIIDCRLIETHAPGLQGLKRPDDLDKRIKLECYHPSREKHDSVRARMLDIFNEKIIETKDCIFVSHGDPITNLYYYLIKKPLVPCLFDDENIGIYVKRGEILKVDISNKKYKVKRILV